MSIPSQGAVIAALCAALVIAIICNTGELSVCGRLRIPAADIHAEVMTAFHGPDCGCCAPLWQGGIASTTADLSAVRVDDTAELVTVDGDRLVLECVEVVPCLRVGNALIGWRGVIRADGDVLIVSAGRAYRFVRL